MKFKVDENLPEDLSELLRDAGWDSMTVVAQQLGGEIDPEIARVCREEQRVLVTFDRGFSNIGAYPPANSAGMIVFRLKIAFGSAASIRVLRRADRVVTSAGSRPYLK